MKQKTAAFAVAESVKNYHLTNHLTNIRLNISARVISRNTNSRRWWGFLMPNKGKNKAAADAKLKNETNFESNEKQIQKLTDKIDVCLQKLHELRGCVCYPFLDVKITPPVVDDIFDDLRTKYNECGGRLDVIIHSSGGDIDAAYNLSMLFRKFGTEELNFIIPRWAKSAATLLVCSGDSILMSPIAELGPLDPQITHLNPIEKRIETFSPLGINATLDMIRNEFKDGNANFAKALVQRLQFPLTLGMFMKSHEISEAYLTQLLETRMLKGADTDTEDTKKIAKTIAERLTTGYVDHGYCINIDEAKDIGINVSELTGTELDIVWKIHRLNKERTALQKNVRDEKMRDRLRGLPPELIPTELPDKLREDKEDLYSLGR
jgi:hypothetical protein